MTSERCDHIRDRLAATGPGSPPAEVAEHLGGCPACRAWVSHLDRLRRVAPGLVPEAPPTVAASVTAALRAGEPTTRVTPVAVTGPPTERVPAVGDVPDHDAARLSGAGAAPGATSPTAPTAADAAVVADAADVTRAVPEVEPTAPTGAAPGGAGAVIPLRRRLAVRLAAVAAAAAAVVAALVVAGGGDEGGTTRLVAAARALETDTWRMTVEGTATLEIDLPEVTVPTPTLPSPPVPRLSVPEPPELPAGLPPEVADRLAERFEELRRRLEGIELPDAPPQVTIPEVQLPTALTMTIRFSGDGEVAAPDRVHLTGTVDAEVAGLAGGPTAASFPTEVIVVGDRAWTRRDDGWHEVPGPTGPLTDPVLDPEALAAAVEGSEVVEDLGTTTIDGVEVHGWAIAPPTPAGLTHRLEVWIDGDDRIREVHQTVVAPADASAGMARWSIDVRMRITDVGIPVTIEPPPADEIVPGPVPQRPAGWIVAWPFTVSVGADIPDIG